ncbi:MAG: transglutaminase domain-containing protein [Eubacterium sp.]|nr:transglutaminase domain-containing protein [Eubacterium sp.]
MSIYGVNTVSKEKKKRRRSAWQNEDVRPFEMCKGLEIDSSVYEISENRYYSLILKGIVVYFITAGGIGSYLTALDVEFNQIIFNIIIFSTAILCAILYHSWKSENLGYLVFFAFYASIMILFRDYINSGFYGVLNVTIDRASIYFDTEGLQLYNERISNRYAAVTISMSIIGVAMNVLLNNYILRRARYMVAIAMALTFNVAAFYMHMEPDTIYIVMVMAGIVMTYVLKNGVHYELSRRDHVFGRTKRGLTYKLDYRSLWQGIVTVLLFVLAVVAAMSTIYDKVTYDAEQTQSENKEATREMFQNFIMLGFFGFINYYPNNGGLSTGELGGVSTINLDYQPDLNVIYTPYSYKMLYIKCFEGDTYIPYENKWYRDDSFEQKSSSYPSEVKVLKEAYEAGEEGTSQAHITVTNVEASALSYQPYYSEGDRKPIFTRQSVTYTVYPKLDMNKTETKASLKGKKSVYLYVAEDNKEVIDDFIKEAGFTKGTPMEVVRQIKDYYEENVPYTIRPGATPWRKDFINYFLTKNRKGYCAHFASAATLILRRMGIPARYCEGYAISFNQMLNQGERVENAAYSDYYDGYNELGETAVVRVTATDADAHAWVEVYDEKFGWTQVEVTPPSGLEEEDDGQSFWDTFNNLFGDGSENANEKVDTGNSGFTLSEADAFMRYLAVTFLIILFGGAMFYFGLRLYPEFKYAVDYRRAGLNDKLILKYSRFVRRKKKKDESFRDKMNYSDQMDYLLPYSESARDRMKDILERAGFSKHEISEEEFGFADQTVEELKKKKEKL